MVSREARPRKPLGFFIMKYFIYYLHKGDNIPCYIGKTNNIKNRLKHHRWSRSNSNYQIEIIDEVENWKEEEEFYIELFKSWGFILENKSNKGRGPSAGRKCNWKDKISKSLKGKIPKWSEQEIKDRKTRLKNKQFALGYKYTDEQKSNCRKGRREIYYQYDLDGNLVKEWWATKIEISTYFNQDSSGLTHALKGRQKTAYGYVWKALEKKVKVS